MTQIQQGGLFHKVEKNIECSYVSTNRHGGAGKGIFSTNNMSYGVGDEVVTVTENRRLLKRQLRLDALLSAKQNHGTEVFCLTETLQTDLEVSGFDALVTDKTDVGLMIQQADCQAVLLYDPVQSVIAAVHCGWRGSVKNILAQTIAVMASEYGVNPADLLGRISPSLGPCCAEFVHYQSELPEEFTVFMIRNNYFDFWQISRQQLMSAGMAGERIATAGICTCCSMDYYSYRRACRENEGRTGRNSSVIYLKKRQ